MALEVGIVGLPGRGKTTLFNALTRAGVGAATSARKTSAWRRSPTSGSSGSRRRRARDKVTPAAVRVVDVPGTGPAAPGQPAPGRRDRSRSSTAFRPDADPSAISRRSSSSCSSPTATTSSGGSSASRSRRSLATRSCARRSRELEQLLAHVEAGDSLARLARRVAARARAADDEAADRRRQRPRRHRPASSRPSCASCRRRRPPPSATARRRSTRSSGGCSRPSTSSRSSPPARRRRARGRFVGARRRSRRRRRSTPTSREASSAARSIRWDDLVEAGSHAEVARRGLQRLEGKTYEVAATATC